MRARDIEVAADGCQTSEREGDVSFRSWLDDHLGASIAQLDLRVAVAAPLEIAVEIARELVVRLAERIRGCRVEVGRLHLSQEGGQLAAVAAAVAEHQRVDERP